MMLGYRMMFPILFLSTQSEAPLRIAFANVEGSRFLLKKRSLFFLRLVRRSSMLTKAISFIVISNRRIFFSMRRERHSLPILALRLFLMLLVFIKETLQELPNIWHLSNLWEKPVEKVTNMLLAVLPMNW